MRKSEYDNRQYEYVTTSCGLNVLLVEDCDSKKTAVSMCIGAGHFADPENCQGLAHLLEHMLFLGSTHYPSANGFNDFLTNHGGNINAWTGTEYSNFHFDINQQHLSQSLHYFADMLAYPLLDELLIDKEINAIDSEFKLKKKDDLRRLYQVHKETCNPAHPFSKFSVGNEQTLRNVSVSALRQNLRKLHDEYYVSGNMRLCIISALPLAEQKALVEKSFCILRTGELAECAPLPELYLPEQLGVQINITPITKARRLILSFAMPDPQQHYQTKPLAFISHILGDEGQGSLLEYLKDNNWATSLSAGGGIQGSNFKDFNLNLQLTQLGLESVPQILNAIFYFISLIKQDKHEKWRFDEKQTLSQLAFDFSDEGKSLDEATHLANQMFHYPEDDLLCGEYLINNPDIDVISEYLALMSPLNMRVKLISKEAPTTQIAKWYETPYHIEKLNPALLEDLLSPIEIKELKLPSANPYIVSNTHLQPIEETYLTPQKIVTDNGLAVWFGQDNLFQQPKGDCFLSFDCSAVSEGVEVSTYKRLWVAMVMEKFQNQYYHAGVAGLHYHLYPHQAGFSLHTNGFSQNQLALCKDLFNQIHDKQTTSVHFQQVKNKHKQALQNSLLNKPINRLFTRLPVIVQRYSFAPADMLPIVEQLTPEHIDWVQEKLFKDYFVECFIHGDWRSKDVMSISETFAKTNCHARNGEKISRDVVDLRNSSPYVHYVSNQHDDAAAVVYFQSPSNTPKDIAMTIVTEQLLAAPFFNELRTNKQLGYLVGSGYMPFNQHPGMAFYIQSPVAPANILVSEILNFLCETQQHMDYFQQVWMQVKSSVSKQLAEKDTNLSMKSQRLWMAIGNDDFTFSAQQRLAKALEDLQFEDIKAFFDQLVNRQGFGEITLVCEGKITTDKTIKGTLIEDINEFKSRANYTI